jgi:hypothetical protein
VRLTPEQWAEVRRLRDDPDLTNKDIAARMGVSSCAIEQFARRRGWPVRRAGPKGVPVAGRPTFEALTVEARRSLIQRLYRAMDMKLKLMERRLEKQLEKLETDMPGADLSSADHERDARAFGTMIKNIDQVKEMQAELDRVAGGQPATAADAELFTEADRFRREIAERLSRFIPSSP